MLLLPFFVVDDIMSESFLLSDMARREPPRKGFCLHIHATVNRQAIISGAYENTFEADMCRKNIAQAYLTAFLPGLHQVAGRSPAFSVLFFI